MTALAATASRLVGTAFVDHVAGSCPVAIDNLAVLGDVVSNEVGEDLPHVAARLEDGEAKALVHRYRKVSRDALRILGSLTAGHSSPIIARCYSKHRLFLCGKTW